MVHYPVFYISERRRGS